MLTDAERAAALAVAGVTNSSGAGASALFLLVYLGAGDKVERNDGSDTLLITPFVSTEYELLPSGMELSAAAPGNR